MLGALAWLSLANCNTYTSSSSSHIILSLNDFQKFNYLLGKKLPKNCAIYRSPFLGIYLYRAARFERELLHKLTWSEISFCKMCYLCNIALLTRLGQSVSAFVSHIKLPWIIFKALFGYIKLSQTAPYPNFFYVRTALDITTFCNDSHV